MRLLICLIASFFVQAANNEIQTARMLKPFASLQKALSSYDGSHESLRELAQELTDGPNRLTTFNIQALGKIYQDYPVDGADDFFGSVRFEAKNLEDAIGTVDKWAALLENRQEDLAEVADGDVAEKEAILKKIADAELNLSLSMEILTFVMTGNKSATLQDAASLPSSISEKIEKFEDMKADSVFADNYWVGTSPTLLEKMNEEIAEYPWLSYKDDREYVIEELRRRLKDIDETPFNFGILEDTKDEKGLHEYRREIRWFNIQVQNLNGTVTYFDNIDDEPVVCPNDALAKLPKVDPKYSVLPVSPFAEEKACGISKCLFYKLADIVAKVGKIKDVVEDLENKKDLHNKTPQEHKEAVQAIYDDMKETEVLDLLRAQLKQCVDGKSKKKN